MASSSSSAALSEYLFSRLKADVSFLTSQSLLDPESKDIIIQRLDRAPARQRDAISNAQTGVQAITSQLAGVAVGTGIGRLPPPLPASQVASVPGSGGDGIERAKALWSYSGSQPDDLNFQKGDIVLIYSKENEHWWRGSVINDPNSRQGLFPSNHVEIIRNDVPHLTSTYSGPAQGSNYYGNSDPEKVPMDMQPYQMPGPSASSQYYNQGPPQQQVYYQQPPPQQMGPIPSPNDPGRKHKFKLPNGMGNTLVHSFVGGAGFGAGSAAAGDLIHAIF